MPPDDRRQRTRHRPDRRYKGLHGRGDPGICKPQRKRAGRHHRRRAALPGIQHGREKARLPGRAGQCLSEIHRSHPGDTTAVRRNRKRKRVVFVRTFDRHRR